MAKTYEEPSLSLEARLSAAFVSLKEAEVAAARHKATFEASKEGVKIALAELRQIASDVAEGQGELFD